ncbi:hypothetical protein EVAR_98591_1 [Eumeta japonica]|uniref:Uncharacterized protein n=1 Tax=Eumeta variegata TaxID=151549 RepID=A0A4C1T5V5_EUMVA|nr:hypothetical protein EVAR_98591_1 [Eumeta japonica]
MALWRRTDVALFRADGGRCRRQTTPAGRHDDGRGISLVYASTGESVEPEEPPFGGSPRVRWEIARFPVDADDYGFPSRREGSSSFKARIKY